MVLTSDKKTIGINQIGIQMSGMLAPGKCSIKSIPIEIICTQLFSNHATINPIFTQEESNKSTIER